VVLLFVVFMSSNSLRSVALNTTSTRVPRPEERARFLSAQSAVQHLASALGAGLSTRLLAVLPDGRLGGMRTLSLFSGALALLLPALLAATTARLAARDRPAAAAALPADADAA